MSKRVDLILENANALRLAAIKHQSPELHRAADDCMGELLFEATFGPPDDEEPGQ